MQTMRLMRRADVRGRNLKHFAACALLLGVGAGCGAATDATGDAAGATVGPSALSEQLVPIPVPTVCPLCAWTLVTGATPTGLAVTNDAVFWSGGTGSFPNWQIGIFSAPIAGGAVTQIYAAPDNQPPDSLVAVGASLFWQQPGVSAGTWTMPQAGGTATKLTTISDLGPQAQGVAGAQTALAGLRGFVTTTLVSSDPSNSHLWRSSFSTLSPRWTTTTLVDFDALDNHGLYYPDNVTLDSTNAYFVTGRYGGALNSVYQVALSGGTPQLIGTKAQYQSPIAVYGSTVYFVRGNVIVAVPVGGGTESTFVTDSGPPTTFAVDGGTLYWTCTTCGTVTKAAFSGGAITPIVANEHSPEFLAVDSSRIYWGATGAVRYRIK